MRLAYPKRNVFHQSLLHCLVVHSLKPKILRRRPRPVQTQISEKRRLIIMVAMALGAFGIGTTEFVSMGLLSMIAEDFQITEDTAGVIITSYALGVVVGAPLITALTGRVPRRRLSDLDGRVHDRQWSVRFADNYEVLLVARFIAGLPHGAYFSVAGLSAASMAPVAQRGRQWRLSAWAVGGHGYWCSGSASFGSSTQAGLPLTHWWRSSA